MKHLKSYENYSVEKLYHYTTLENAIKILDSGEIKVKEMNIINKYSSSDLIANDYGYISFTTNDDEDSIAFDIPKDIRFILDKEIIENEYELEPFSFDSEQEIDYEERYGELSDLDKANMDWYGNEEELRSYKNIPIKYIETVEIFYGGDTKLIEELKKKCDKLNINFVM
ncbi:MAG: hypothetical protein M0R46_13835 [Candidatus Muirbacterium halophilum]|nr:hypothetical protein [Candidatus Muirbacterium halophilum]